MPWKIIECLQSRDKAYDMAAKLRKSGTGARVSEGTIKGIHYYCVERHYD